MRLHLVIFFFQAEDGIRDVAVTGVQTCALPICLPGDFVCVDEIQDVAEIADLESLRFAALASSRWHTSKTRRSEEHTSELQSRLHLVCRLLLEKKKNIHFL